MECSVNGPQPDITVFEKITMGKNLMAVVAGQELGSIVMTRFERRRIDVIMSDGSQIEVAADKGEIIAEKREPILEIELELKNGEVAALFRLGSILAKEFPLLPEGKSKYYRGLTLAEKDLLQVKEAQQLIQMDKRKLASEELRRLLVELISQYQ